MKKHVIWGVVALLILTTLACSLGGKTATPPAGTSVPPAGATSVPPAGATSVPPAGATATVPSVGQTPTPSAEEAPPPALSSDTLESLNSYRSRLVWQQTVEGGDTETTTIEMEETREPAAQRMVLTVEGGDNPGTMEMVRIGDMAWMCSPDGGCIQTQMSGEESTGFGEGLLLNPEEFASAEYRYVGRETVNGVRSRHYTLNIPPEMLEDMATQGTVTAAQAEVWIADEAGMPAYMARLIISYEGKTEDGKNLTGQWTWDIYDVNKPFTIQPPEGAPTMPTDIPIYPGATDKSMMGNLIIFSSTDPVEDVAEFYRTEMPGLGWTAGAESTLGNMITQEWTKGNRKASLMISPKDEGGCSVIITVEQP